MTTDTQNPNPIPKPRWVECADKASEQLEKADAADNIEERQLHINTADAWMRLSAIYRDGPVTV